MPGHMVHAYVDRLFFGKAYWKVHRAMDCVWYVWRRSHRRYLHTRHEAFSIAVNAYPGDPNAISAAYLHIELDEYCSANPEYKKELEMLAKEDVRERKQKRRNRKKMKDVLPENKEFLRTLEKLAEIQRLRELILRKRWKSH